MIKKYSGIIIFLSILILIMTYPLLIKINSCIPGFFSTDETYGTLWNYWRIKHAAVNQLSLESTEFLAYPYGLNMYSSGTVYYLHSFMENFLLKVVSPALMYNLQVFFNFLLSGFFMFLLVQYITKDKIAGFFSAAIYAFCPYQFVRSWQHLSLTYNQWIPLCLLAIFLVKDKCSKKNMLFFVGAFLLLFSFDYSIVYSTMVGVAFFIIYATVRALKRREELKFIGRTLLLLTIVFVILIPQLLPVLQNFIYKADLSSQISHTYVKDFGDLFVQSAKPLSYFLPAITHPIFGKLTESFVGTKLYGESLTEHTLYLGWIPLILAFYAVRRWRKLKEQTTDRRPETTNFYMGYFIFLAIIAWLFSQSPWWSLGPLKIYMPSFFMYKLLPMFRAYCRFGIVVMLAVAVLAGFGLKFFLNRFKSKKVRIGLAGLFLGLTLFEFWNWPPYKVIDISQVPSVYYWLQQQLQDSVVAEYPIDTNGQNEMYKFYQTKHEKKIVNGSIPGTEANMHALTIKDLSKASTTNILKQMGVKYVLVHQDGYLETGLVEDRDELELIPGNRDLALINYFPMQECPNSNTMCVQKSGSIDVYEVK